MISLRAHVLEEFGHRFGAASHLARAPGRVNLIGEHTDYNAGFVLPMAIDRAVWVACRPRSDRRVVVHSLDFDETAQFELDHIERGGHHWVEYVKGVAWALLDAGHTLRGWEGVVCGDVPRGAGLSSSAALELAIMRIFTALAGSPWDPARMARTGQRVENEWIGVNSGIMDQMVSACARAGHALLLDCRTLMTQNVPIPAGVSVIVLDSATRRGLVDSAYNERRRQCEEAAAACGASALRDVTLAQLEARRTELSDVAYRRARHVVTENARTLAAAAALRAGDASAFGKLMNESHASMRDDFEITNRELDRIVALAQAEAGCFGARMTGGGFGGCAVALVASDAADRFIDRVTVSYQDAIGLEPHAYVCRAAGGADLEADTSTTG